MTNMNYIRIAAIILILGVASACSYFIIKNSLPEVFSNNGVDKKSIEENSQITVENPIQYVKNSSSSESKNNFTENLSQVVFDQIISNRNKTEFVDYSPTEITSISNNIINNLLKDKQSGLNIVFDINDSVLKISSDNSHEAKIKYLNAIEEIGKRNWNGSNKIYLEVIVDVYQKNNYSSAIQLADIYKNLSDEYLATVVPSDWKEIHKAAIIHFENAETIYRAMADYANDPIKGYFALEMIDSVVNNGTEIQNIFAAKFKEL